MNSKRHRPSRPKASKPRTEAQKLRRKELWLAREADRQTAAETRCLARYEELKAEMACQGQTIGTLSDALAIEDPGRRADVVKARVERWDALWGLTLRKRDLHGKIVLGGAILAELAVLDLRDEKAREFHRRLIELLDERVLRVRDRLLLRDLVSGATAQETPLPLRPGGDLNEPLADALAAIGEGFAAFDVEAMAMAVGAPSADLTTDEREAAVALAEEV